MFSKLSYSQRKAILYVFKIVGFCTVFLLGAYFGLGWSIESILANKRFLDPQFIAFGIIIVISFLLGVVEISILNKTFDWLDEQIFNLKNVLKGNSGEKQTFERLRQMLGNQYKIHRNIRPNKTFDIDAVVVGPKGIITFEIKNLGNKYDTYRFERQDTFKIQRYSNGNECSCRLGKVSNPINEAIRHNQALEEWLMKNGFDNIKVRGAILMTSEAKIELKPPLAIYVIQNLDGIKRYIDSVPENKKFTSEFCEKLNKLIYT